MEKAKIIALIEGYAAGTLTPEDEIVFFGWYSKTGLREFLGMLAECDPLSMDLLTNPAMPDEFRSRMEQAIGRPAVPQSRYRAPILSIFHVYRRWIAAAILILAIIGGWRLFRSSPANPAVVTNLVPPPHDVLPGGNKAILTLSDGSKISLDSAANGLLAEQGTAKITKTDSGRLAYQSSPLSQTTDLSPQYNTLMTPRGGQYQLTLPDGSHVWLDASSSITYPTAFHGAERRVTITGQAYLEIVHNSDMPFRVSLDGSEIEDLGTAFNINAYPDEPDTKFTLAEGSIVVRKGTQIMPLRPGQQSVLSTGGMQLIRNADLEAVLAWKNGHFTLKSTDLRTLMRQLARWYDIDIAFEKDVPDRQFGGSVSRNTNLSVVIAAMQQYGIPCRLEGRKLIVGQ